MRLHFIDPSRKKWFDFNSKYKYKMDYHCKYPRSYEGGMRQGREWEENGKQRKEGEERKNRMCEKVKGHFSFSQFLIQSLRNVHISSLCPSYCLGLWRGSWGVCVCMCVYCSTKLWSVCVRGIVSSFLNFYATTIQDIVKFNLLYYMFFTLYVFKIAYKQIKTCFNNLASQGYWYHLPS